jgi:hypothetical protein
MENSTFWNRDESSAASSMVTRVNMSADGRRPAARAKRKYDSPSDVALNGEVWRPLMKMKRIRVRIYSIELNVARVESTYPLKTGKARESSVAI